jgi:hypothetical protein
VEEKGKKFQKLDGCFKPFFQRPEISVLKPLPATPVKGKEMGRENKEREGASQNTTHKRKEALKKKSGDVHRMKRRAQHMKTAQGRKKGRFNT